MAPAIRDSARISSGSLRIEMNESIDHPFGKSSIYGIPEIAIFEHTAPLIIEDRALVLNLPKELRDIADWYVVDAINYNVDIVDRFEISKDTLIIFVTDTLPAGELR